MSDTYHMVERYPVLSHGTSQLITKIEIPGGYNYKSVLLEIALFPKNKNWDIEKDIMAVRIIETKGNNCFVYAPGLPGEYEYQDIDFLGYKENIK